MSGFQWGSFCSGKIVNMTEKKVTIGVLAIQGAVEEHMVVMSRLGCKTTEIRVPADFAGVDGIILPGGESTAMAIVGEECGLFPELQKWVDAGRPIWGTCAGMILLSDHAIKQANGGQSLVGGLDVHICRNYFGSQVYSCELEINIESSMFASLHDTIGATAPFNAVFIRAPAILKCGPKVTILGSIMAKPHRSALKEVVELLQSDLVNQCALNVPVDDQHEEASQEKKRSSNDCLDSLKEEEGWIAKRQRSGSNVHQGSGTSDSQQLQHSFNVAVAVRQNNILATAFHPELTNDTRWHRYFLEMVVSHDASESQMETL